MKSLWSDERSGRSETSAFLWQQFATLLLHAVVALVVLELGVEAEAEPGQPVRCRPSEKVYFRFELAPQQLQSPKVSSTRTSLSNC